MGKDFKDRFERWVESPYNDYTSFTMGRALKEYMKQDPQTEGSRVQDGRYIWEMIEQGITSQYGIDQEIVKNFPYKAMLELCDISILQEIAKNLYFDEKNYETNN